MAKDARKWLIGGAVKTGPYQTKPDPKPRSNNKKNKKNSNSSSKKPTITIHFTFGRLS